MPIDAGCMHSHTMRMLDLLLLSCCFGYSYSAHNALPSRPLHLEEAIKNILDDQNTYAGTPMISRDVLEKECHISPDESCPLEDMSDSVFTLVYPGGGTRCIEDSLPYRFQASPKDAIISSIISSTIMIMDALFFCVKVVRGDPQKLLFYLQGGGAW